MVLKEHRIKVVKTRKWYNYFLKRSAKKALLAAGFAKATELIEGRTMFLTIGKQRYLFTTGNNFGSSMWDLVTLAHELKHLLQEIKLGKKTYKQKYANSRYRAIIEGQAYAVSWLMVDYLDIGDREHKAFGEFFGYMYWLSDRDVDAAERHYKAVIEKHPNQKAVQEIAMAINAVKGIRQSYGSETKEIINNRRIENVIGVNTEGGGI